jgi:anti-sigma B factor antagonist
MNRDRGQRVARPGALPLGPGRDRRPRLDAGRALRIRVRREPAYVLVTVAGELDIATAPGLYERLSALAAEGGTVVADLDDVSFIDAAGLGALARAARQAARHGSTLLVVCGQRQTRRLFRLTEVDRIVPLSATLAEALRAAHGTGTT